jgi:hypothetical protein
VSLAFFMRQSRREEPMKRLGFLAAVGLLLVTSAPDLAVAVIPFSKAWTARYVDGNANKEFVAAAGAAKCNVCHKGASKKEHNEYGLALKKHLKKKEYEALNAANPAAAAKYIQDGLDAAAKEKNAAGKTFGELIKEGKLPGGQ